MTFVNSQHTHKSLRLFYTENPVLNTDLNDIKTNLTRIWYGEFIQYKYKANHPNPRKQKVLTLKNYQLNSQISV